MDTKEVPEFQREDACELRRMYDDLCYRLRAAIVEVVEESGQGSPQHLRLRYALTGEGPGAPSAAAMGIARFGTIRRGSVFDWSGARCAVQRIAEDRSWIDLTVTSGGSSWGKRMALPLPEMFVRVA